MKPKVRVLAGLGVLLALAGCRAADADPAGPTAGAEAATATVTRGSLTSTVILPAQVEAGAVVRVTAPAAGRYTVRGNSIEYDDAAGRSHTVALPGGVVIHKSLVAPGAQVPLNFPVAEARVTGFALVGTLDQSALYRLYARPGAVRGQVTEGPGPFGCPLADPVPAAAGDAPVVLTCVVPPNARVFAGMPAVMAVETGTAEDVLMLPVEAVAGAAESGSVWLIDAAGKRVERQVRLGVTDGASIEIRSGLAEGDTVAVPGPDLADSPGTA